MGRKIKVIIMIGVIIIYGLAILFWFRYYHHKGNPISIDETKYSLNLEITPEINGTYLIYAPLFILKNGSISKINNEIHVISGSAELDIINTFYGTAISINSSEKVIIQMNGTKKPDFEMDRRGRPEIYLSLEQNNTRIWETGPHNYWLYLNNSILNNISIKIVADARGVIGDGGMVTINSVLSNGWNICEGEMIGIISPV